MNGIIKFLKDWIVPIIVAVILATLINKFLFFNVRVPTGSMFPTIKPGDRILVLRNHSKNSLQRGDVVVFHNDETEDDLIKRLVGLPGESVEIKSDGSLYINGTLLEEPYVKYPSELTGNFNVPEGHYLFLGDNRADSADARYWENPYIPYEQIMGKGKFIIYPFDRLGSFK